MLGVYENFPVNVHLIANFHSTTPIRKLQKNLTRIFHRLNTRKFRLEDIAHPSISQCAVIFEFGIAESNIFNYLDKSETSRILRIAQRTPFRTMDFFCAIRYYKMQKGKDNSLRFDYYMLRFTFYNGSTETLVFHERGPRHVSPSELVSLIFDRINQVLPKKIEIDYEF